MRLPTFSLISYIRAKIRWKLLLVLLFLVAIALALTNVLWVYSIRPLLREHIIETQEEVAQHAAFRIEEFIQAKVRNLILHSQSATFLEKNIPAAQAELAIILKQDGDLREISFLDQHGKELAKVTPQKVFPQEELEDQSQASKFIIPTFRYGAEYRSRVYFSGEREPMITLSVPLVIPLARQNIEEISTVDPSALQRGTEDILGVLTAEASLKDILVRSTESFDVGQNGFMYLVDEKGRLIAHPHRPAGEHEDILQADIMQQHAAKDEQIFQETGGHPFEHILTSQGADAAGQEVLATLYEIPRLRWGVVIQHPRSEVFAALGRVERFALILFLGGIGMTIAVSFWLSYLLTKSIEALRRGVEIISKGRLGYRVQIRTHDEIQRLAEAFNTMVQSIEEMRQRDQEVSRMKSEFLSIAAHQLRTPLSALKWVLNMSLEGDVGKLAKGQRELLEKGYSANERMIALVNDLLDAVRIEEGRFDYKFRKVNLIKLVGKMVEDMKLIADQKEVRLTFHKPSQAIPDIAVDSEKLRLAFMNIVDNAVRYTSSKGQVDIEATLKEKEILVLVRDTGIGIPKAQLDRLFTKFFRSQNAISMQPSGSGLGLFIAKNIIEKHKGKIWIESTEGKGTTVYFTIPVSNFKK